MAFIKEIRDILRAMLTGSPPPPSTLHSLLEAHEHLLLWGANNDSKEFIGILAAKGLPVSAIVDNDTCKQSKSLEGVKIVSPMELPEYNPMVILIASRYHNSVIARQLQEMGYLYDIHFADHPLLNGEQSFAASFFNYSGATDGKPTTSCNCRFSAKEQSLLDAIRQRLFPLLPEEPKRGWIIRKEKPVNKDSLRRPF